MSRLLKEDAEGDILAYKNAKIRFDRQRAEVSKRMDMEDKKTAEIHKDGYSIGFYAYEANVYYHNKIYLQCFFKLDGANDKNLLDSENFIFDMYADKLDDNAENIDQIFSDANFKTKMTNQIKKLLFGLLGLSHDRWTNYTLDEFVRRYSLEQLKEKAVNFAEIASKIDMNSLIEEVTEVAKKVVVDSKKASNNFYKYRKAVDKRKAAVNALKNKARQSIYDEAPDFAENTYAYWASKNGIRRVTVLTIDEPNQRAKINTDKGATMYVPLSTLSKDEDEIYKVLED